MNIYKDHSLKSEKVAGNLTRSEFHGLFIWFSYKRPIAISSESYVIIIDKNGFAITTIRHINHIKKLIVSTRVMNDKEFEKRLDRILDKTSNKRWNSHD